LTSAKYGNARLIRKKMCNAYPQICNRCAMFGKHYTLFCTPPPYVVCLQQQKSQPIWYR